MGRCEITRHFFREHSGSELILQLQPHFVHIRSASVLPEVQRPVPLLEVCKIRNPGFDAFRDVDRRAPQVLLQRLPYFRQIPVHVHPASFQHLPGDLFSRIRQLLEACVALSNGIIRQPLQIG